MEWHNNMKLIIQHNNGHESRMMARYQWPDMRNMDKNEAIKWSLSIKILLHCI